MSEANRLLPADDGTATLSLECLRSKEDGCYLKDLLVVEKALSEYSKDLRDVIIQKKGTA
jgi:hypothetical protein